MHVRQLLWQAPWTLLSSMLLRLCWEDSSQTSTTPVPFYAIPSHPMEDDSSILNNTEASRRALFVRQSQAGHTLQLRIVEFLSLRHQHAPQERWWWLNPPSCSMGVPTSWFRPVLHSSAARQQEQHSHSLARLLEFHLCMINLALAHTDVMVFFRLWTSAVVLSAEMMSSTYRLFKTSSTSKGYLVLKFCNCNLKVPASKKGDENQ